MKKQNENYLDDLSEEQCNEAQSDSLREIEKIEKRLKK